MSGRRLRIALLAALVLGLVLPVAAVAHPLGNFTINHYAGLRVEPERVLLDIVVDQAEIPAFQARLAFDTDGDGSVSEEEVDAGRASACRDLVPDLALTANGAGLALELDTAGLGFPLGSGGLSTMRLVCGFSAALPEQLGEVGRGPVRIAFADRSFADRLGWREIVAVGSGTRLSAVEGTLRDASPSLRLTAYPESLVTRPLDDRSIVLDAVADPSVAAAAFAAPDAEAIDGGGETPGGGGPTVPSSPAGGGADGDGATTSGGSVIAAPPLAGGSAAAVPGGVGGTELPSIFRAADLTPVVLLLSVLTAVALGAGHALTPGHGKTLMAAYLVGTRGTPLHALGLGLSVSISHTVGILVLAAIVVGAADVLPPDVVVRGAPVVAAISIVAIGGWMLIGELRRRRGVAVATTAKHGHEHGHEHGHDDGHGHDEHGHGHDGHDELGHRHGHGHGHGHDEHDPSEHRHGGIRHSHLPPGSSISWRSLFVLGLAGGLIPSTSALLILLGSIAAGRPAYGFVLVAAFGLGMAAVMAGVGLVMVAARDRMDRLPAVGGLVRIRATVPLVAAVLVFGFGLYLTAQAIAGAPTL